MAPEGRGFNLVVMIVIALATFLLPIVQRWLRQRAERAGTLPRKEEEVQEVFDPFQDFRDDEPGADESLPQPRREDEAVEEPEPAKPPPRVVAPEALKPLLQSAAPVPRRPGFPVEERLFANRRWSPGAKLIIAKEILDRPRGFRKGP